MTKIHFGVSRSATRFDDYADWVRLVESCGYELLGFGDSQFRWGDCHAVIAVTAMNSSRLTIGPFITNPVTRHPSVTANAMSTLQAMSGGRVFCGIGNGETSVRDLGQRSVSLADFEDYVLAVRGLCAGEEVVYQGQPMRMLWDVPRVPVWVAGDGPKMLQLAGRIADAAIVGNGATPELIRYAREQVSIGAAQVGRDPAGIDVWFMVRVLITKSEADGFDAYRFYLASYANTRYQAAVHRKGIEVPPDIAERLRGFRSEFRYGESLRPDTTFNAELVDKYGLREWLGRQFAITGPADECIAKLEVLAQAGGTHLVLPQMHADIMGTTRQIATDILPAFG
jgi:5,10-methylenetetrahydromethanopterin reductase